MNKVRVEKSGDGIYLLTLPGGGQRHNLSAGGVAKALNDEIQEFQKASENMKAVSKKYQEIAAG